MDTLKTTANKSEKPRNLSLIHAKSNTRIACWNVRSVGSLSDQSEKLHSVLWTMKEKNIELMVLSESHWTGQGISKICSYTLFCFLGLSLSILMELPLFSALRLVLPGRKLVNVVFLMLCLKELLELE